MLATVVVRAAIDAGILDASSEQRYANVSASKAYFRILNDTERRTATRGPGSSREYQLLQVLAQILYVPFIADLNDIAASSNAVSAVPAALLYEHVAIPLACTETMIRIATCDPFKRRLEQAIEQASRRSVEIVFAEREQITSQLKTQIGVGGESVGTAPAYSETFDELLDEEGDPLTEDATVIKLVNDILIDAIESGATDVHIEPDRHGFSLQYRIDGLMRPQPIPAEMHQLHGSIVSRLKIMAKLNIAEKRLPQDGKLVVSHGEEEIDVRVSVIPMVFGESVVLRLLARHAGTWALKTLNLPALTHGHLENAIDAPHGLILVTGPTGSGKTTTLYHCLGDLRTRRPRQKIVTIEDPVEYTLPGVQHIQVNASTGLSFARALRSVLRHDPDVLLIGEIRDSETARSVVQASLTGHLVLATLHTNDTASAFARLVDMGVEPYLVASTVRLVLAQRLLRTVCDCCANPLRDALGDRERSDPECQTCMSSGYSGRAAVVEALPVDHAIREMCASSAPSTGIARYAAQQGHMTIRQCAEQLVAAGKTTREEVMRVFG